MNKTELVTAISFNAELSKKDSEKALEAFVETVMETVKRGEDVQIVGFGTFTSSERAEREGRNPATGEKMTIAARRAPKFKPGKIFKDQLA